MKTFASAVLFAAAASAEQLFDLVNDIDVTSTPLSTNVTKTELGALVEESVYDDFIEKNITFPFEHYATDYEMQADHIKELTGIIKNHNEILANGGQANYADIYTCSNRNPEDDADPSGVGEFLPVFIADLTENNPQTVSFEGRCYGNVVMTFEKTSVTTFDVTVDLSEKKSMLCKDYFMFANTEIQHFEVFFRAGTHKLHFNMPTIESQKDVAFGGIKVFQFCEGVVGTLKSVIKTLSAFVGGISDHPWIPILGSHVPPYMEKANVDFLSESMGLQLTERPIHDVDIEPDLIQSGDFFLIMRLDGLDPLIMYATGSHGAHCVMALRFEGELYIVESQDAWYWPTAGLQRTPFKKWIKQARNADFHVVWLPLSGRSLLKFDEGAANDWFFESEGLPYGYHNFIYGWFDTVDSNLPPILPTEFPPILFAMLEEVMPETIHNMYGQGMNKRLGTEGLKIAELAAKASEKMMTLQDVQAIPEQDGWLYTSDKPRDGQSFVCSAYVASMFKAAGMFDDMYINATEFTPRDIYQLDFFDLKFKRPEVCVEADPDLPYCQLSGKYRIELPSNDYNVVTPYPHMDEACPTMAPFYERPAGC